MRKRSNLISSYCRRERRKVKLGVEGGAPLKDV